MPPIFQQFKTIFWQNIYLKSKFKSPTIPTTCRSFLVYIHYLHIPHNRNPGESKSPFKGFHFVHSVANSLSLTAPQNEPANELAIQVQNIFKNYRDSPTRKIELALNHCCLTLTEDLILNVLRRHRSDWKPAFIFFNWVSKGGQIILDSGVYNEILDILGKMRRFGELNQVLDEMTNRGGLVNEETYRVLVNRYAAAHKVEEAIEVFNKRRDLGLELDLAAFQKLLMCLCRYKHVEVAETLLYSKGNDFGRDIKTMNIVLNGWCVLGNVHEAKRFWKDIVSSKCKPDLFTYGTFIKALTKKGKLGKAMKLYRAMWEKHCKPDAVICNCIIDALCFKKRIPEALEVFREMSELGCLPNVATYNSLIKHLCKIQRMEKVYELLDEMQDKKGSCMPNDITFNFLLQALKKPEQLPWVLEGMERNECKINGDTYNLILKLYVAWDCEERIIGTWNEMEKYGLGPDRRSYTIIIHWLHHKGRIKDALHYFWEMKSKGMVPEPRTEILVNAMSMKSKENDAEQEEKGAINSKKSSSSMRKRIRKIRAG
ncbi:putative pentatricopeptide repeat-containing protein At3g15200 [Hevea brasiliensis]|uniref:putative pentatricopeptide repeat-containing protein At3g15200 n=1 Tax=Hevea brasiliensis TaxID=3981 RepID=UPI0025FE5866|nr:putative pentatricopeptide repeat-containing protein At3g15200 [Hevea brasiliensis]XP_057992476.1 putative pentatricopeptide repeat-containing protein At3g15200 [Hevea brasiliensis]